MGRMRATRYQTAMQVGKRAEYARMQVLSVQEMLRRGERPEASAGGPALAGERHGQDIDVVGG